jgi:hypothetical protein
MTRPLALLAAALLLLAASAPAALATADKVAVCHYDTDTGTWVLIQVSDNGSAVDKHLAHGDAYPGDPVPNMPGYHFDGACVPVADSPLVFAVAWTNVDGIPGYDPSDGDVLIAEIVDTDGSGTLSAGDSVVMGQYPTSFSAPYNFGNWGVTSHTITSIGLADPTDVSVSSSLYDGYDFMNDPLTQQAELYGESTQYSIAQLQDSFTSALPDAITLYTGSPSAPQADFFALRYNDSNDPFIDVAITLSGARY